MSSNAYALSTQAASKATFNFSQEIDYYLKGTFNSWEQNAEYRFVSNTASMTPETNKIKEFKLENVALNKGSELKVWGNNDVWYKDGANDCSYEHSWTNDETFTDGEDHNYLIPMTSNTYSFYLKFYSDGSSKLFITANKDVLFFVPSNNWKTSEANFAIEQYDGEDLANTILESVENPSGTFKFNIGATYTRYKFIRRNNENTANWNSSNIQTIGNDDTNNCFSLWDEYYGNGQGVWSDWNAAGGNEYGVSCGTWSTL